MHTVILHIYTRGCKLPGKKISAWHSLKESEIGVAKGKKKSKNPKILIECALVNCSYLVSTQLQFLGTSVIDHQLLPLVPKDVQCCEELDEWQSLIDEPPVSLQEIQPAI